MHLHGHDDPRQPIRSAEGASGLRPPIGQCNELIQPAISHHRIVIEQHQVLAPRRLQSLIDRRRETRFVVLEITVTGTAAASCTPAR